MGTEFELLKYCSEAEPASDIAERINTLASRVSDWQKLLQLANYHKVLPLLYINLKRYGGAQVPETILKDLKKYYHQNGLKNIVVVDVLNGILALLKEHGIDAVSFKGPILAEGIFGNLSYRAFDDIDLLIRQEDAWQTIQLLEKNGFDLCPKLTESQFEKYSETEPEIFVIKKNTGHVVDLHWDVVWGHYKFPLDLDIFSKRLVLTELSNRETKTLSNEDNLLYLCIHGSFNSWDRLQLVCCVAESLRSCPNLDWNYITSMAKRFQARTVLLSGLLLAHKLLRAPLPDVILEATSNNRKVTKLVEQASAKLAHADLVVPKKLTPARMSAWHLKCQDNFLAVFRFVYWIVFSPTIKEWRYMPLPASLSFLHYIFRPFRLLYVLIKNVVVGRQSAACCNNFFRW